MKSAIFTALSIAAMSAWAQTAIGPPLVGFMQDPAGSFRPVYGLAGNFVVGDPSATGVISAAFSGSFGLLKTETAVLLTDRQGAIVATGSVPGGPALFAFSRDGRAALAYLADSNGLLRWNGRGFVRTPLDSAAITADAVWSIAAPDPRHAAFLVEREGCLWEIRVRLATGKVDAQLALPGLSAPALLLGNGDVVSRESGGLLVRKPDGSEVHIPAQLPDSFSLRQMGDGWVELRGLAGGGDFAVRVSANREGFYALPEVSQ